MTAREMVGLIGQRGLMNIEGMAVAVQVVDARVRFGAVDVQVEPVTGAGAKWTPRDRVVLVDD